MTQDRTITILRPQGDCRQARKTILKDGTIRNADLVKHFTHETRTFEGIEGLHNIVSALARQNACVVRGAPATQKQPIYRRKAFVMGRDDNGFIDVPKRWLAIDIDDLKLPALTDWREDPLAAVEYAIGRLPECFWDVSSSWSFTGSHGLERNDKKRWTGGTVGDVVRLRLWFCLSRAIGSVEARAWLRSMRDMAPVDDVVAGEVQQIYVARPQCVGGTDPLASLGIPLLGFRKGLEQVVEVPPNLAEEARWARAEGRGAACASHPSADSAIASIGKPSYAGGGRGEIRSHLMSAALHLARTEWKVKRAPKPNELHEAICWGIKRYQAEIDANLKQGGRTWAEVHAYIETDNLRQLCAWACVKAEEDGAKTQDGGGGRKRVVRLAEPPPPPQDVVFVTMDEARAIGAVRKEAFVAAVFEYARRPLKDDFGDAVTDPAPQHLLTLPTGGGKTHVGIEAVREITPLGAVGWLIPNLALGDEAARRIRAAAPELHVAVRRGRAQPDPKQPGQLMCHRIDDAKAVMEQGLSVGRTLCRFVTERKSETLDEATGKRTKGTEKTVTLCPHHGVCGYIRQAQDPTAADVIVMAHAHLYLGIPNDVPKLVAAFVDESAWGGAIGGTDAPVGVGLGLLTDPPVLIDGALRHSRVELGRALAKEPDGPVRGAVLAPFSWRAQSARKDEWWHVRELDQAITGLTGEALRSKLKKAQGGAYGTRAVKRMAEFWRAVETAGELPEGARSGHLWLHITDKETGAREVRMAWREHLSAGWEEVPLLLMDATADVTVLSKVFTRVEPSPRYAVRNPHVKVMQVVDRALSHATLVGPGPEFDSDGSKRMTARRNAEKVKARVLADAFDRYGGEDVLAVVPLAVEEQWRADPLPPWLHILHHGATVGIDAYRSVRAVYVIGRTLPRADVLERMAGALTGVAVEEREYVRTPSKIPTRDGGGVLTEALAHRDPLCEAIRRQVTEAGLVQAAGRIRAINRTEQTPADIHLWTDVAVHDLGAVEAMTWVGPTIDELMFSKGAWLERARDAAAVHEGLGSHQYIDRERGESLSTFANKGLYRQKLTSSPLPVVYRVDRVGSGEARALFLLPEPEAARALLVEKLGPLDRFEALTAMRASATTVLCCREGTADTPLTLKGGRPLMVATWEFEDCLRPPGEPAPATGFMFRREGGNVSIYMNGDAPWTCSSWSSVP